MLAAREGGFPHHTDGKPAAGSGKELSVKPQNVQVPPSPVIGLRSCAEIDSLAQ